jgi:HYR domain
MRATVAAPLALVVALALAGGAAGSPKRGSGTLQLQSKVGARFSLSNCPPGTPTRVYCVRFAGSADLPGLGHATETYTKTVADDRSCPTDRPVAEFTTAVIEVAGKGRIDLSMAGPSCEAQVQTEVGPLEVTITGGSGRYEGASGRVQFRSSVGEFNNCCGCGGSSDSWTGTLTVPGLEFDLTPPVFSGAVSKTVLAPKQAPRVRVRYTVRAKDAVNGSVGAACKPRSGGFFRLGRTVVRCSTTDSSANRATARFRITVKTSRR